MDRHPFDADQDPTSQFDVDSDPTPKFYTFWKISILFSTSIHNSASLHCFIYLAAVMFFTVYLTFFWRKLKVLSSEMDQAESRLIR